jgi:hypothetical protein
VEKSLWQSLDLHIYRHTYTFTNDNGSSGEGTFSFTDSTITFIPTAGDGWTQDYTLDGSKLTLVQESGGHPYGPFEKQ